MYVPYLVPVFAPGKHIVCFSVGAKKTILFLVFLTFFVEFLVKFRDY